MDEQQRINWEEFASPYWSPEKGEKYNLVLAYWRQETRSYDGDKTAKPVIVFDVLKVNNEEFARGRKLFASGAYSFAEEVKPIILDAERRGVRAIKIMLKYGTDKKYTLIDLYEPEKEVEKNYLGLKQ